MRRKLIASALAIGVLAAGAIVLHRAAPGPALATTAPAALPAAPPAPAAPAIAEAPEAPEAPAQPAEITQTLKGRDFSLRVSVNGNESFRDLQVEMDDGTPVRLLRTLAGETGELSNMTFAPADTFELVKLIPGETREQIVCKGSSLLNRGEGMLDTYTLYRIEGDHLQELISVITMRDREEDEGMPAQKLKASIEATTRDGQPAFLYRVKTGNAPEQTIVFLWNGKQFEEASGAYRKIEEANAP